MAQRTLPRLLETSAARFGGRVLLWEKRGDAFLGTTYGEVREMVHQFAAGLIELGIRKQDRVALLAEGRNDWVVAELGILYAGAVNVPLSVKLDELSELQFRLAHAGCRMAVVSGRQARKVMLIRGELPSLETIILLDPLPLGEPGLIFKTDLLEQGKSYLKQNWKRVKETWQAVAEDDPANICYTSGTTADPKGIVLTHRNYTANIEQCSALLPVPEHYTSLLILPWDHAFAHTTGIYTLMKNGASMASVQMGKTAMETLKNIPLNIRETQPTFLLSVPSLAQNFRRTIEKGVRGKGRLVSWLFAMALRLAYRYNGEGWNRGRGWRKMLKPLVKSFDRILFRKIRLVFGGRLEFFIGGGALLDIELQRFFYAVGIPMYQGYGLTEAAPVISANVPRSHKLGSSGRIVRDLQVRICDERGRDLPSGKEGEIVVKGENVTAEYWGNEKATREAIRDGWLHTGDLGYFDADGFLYVLGREKSLLISSDGEKCSPEGIEAAILAHSSSIDQIMLYNNQSPNTVALVVPNRQELSGFLKKSNLSLQTSEGQMAALRFLEAEIGSFRRQGTHARFFAGKWLPSALGVLAEPFSEQNHFLNSTLKMVRGRISGHYGELLQFLFTAEGKDVCNLMNMAAISRLDE